MGSKKKKPSYKIPFTPDGDLVTWVGGDTTWEIAGPRSRGGIDVRSLGWEEVDDSKFRGSLEWAGGYTGRSRARIVMRIVEKDAYIEMSLNSFNSLLPMVGMQGTVLPPCDYTFVKRGQNYLCEPDWDKVKAEHGKESGLSDPRDA